MLPHKFNRTTHILIAVCLVFTVLMAAVGTAFAQATWTRIDVGGQGFISTIPNFDKNAKVAVVNPNRVYSIRFVKPVMRLTNSKDLDKTDMISSLTTVYFDLNSTQQQQWKRGALFIYYYDAGRNMWVRLNSNPAVARGSLLRVSAPVRNYGRYGLGLRADVPLVRNR